MKPVTDPTAKAAVFANDRAHVFHSWSAQGALNPMVIAGAQGITVIIDPLNETLDVAESLCRAAGLATSR